jgi:hypothetical protein
MAPWLASAHGTWAYAATRVSPSSYSADIADEDYAVIVLDHLCNFRHAGWSGRLAPQRQRGCPAVGEDLKNVADELEEPPKPGDTTHRFRACTVRPVGLPTHNCPLRAAMLDRRRRSTQSPQHMTRAALKPSSRGTVPAYPPSKRQHDGLCRLGLL